MSVPIIVLAGGKGTRIAKEYPFTHKCMIPIHGTPFLQLLIEKHYLEGYREFYISVGFKSNTVTQHPWNKKFPLAHFNFDYCTEGTGPAVREIFNYYGINKAWVVNGDTYPTFSLPKEPTNTYFACDNEPQDCGSVYVTRRTLRLLKTEHSLHDILEPVTKGRISGRVYDIGTPEGLTNFKEYYELQSRTSPSSR